MASEKQLHEILLSPDLFHKITRVSDDKTML